MKIAKAAVFVCLSLSLVAGPVLLTGRVEAATTVAPPPVIVAWFLGRTAPLSVIDVLAQTKIVTHVIISNSDFQDAPTPTADSLAKLRKIREVGLTPIWERDLWFRRWTPVRDFSAAFVEGYKSGNVIYDPEYYAVIMKRLRDEANSLSVALTTIDVEVYGGLEGFKERFFTLSDQDLVQLEQAVAGAFRKSGVSPADYVYPSGSSGNPRHAYYRLAELGKSKATEGTYVDCPLRLDKSLREDVDLVGVWLTSEEQCYRPGTSCHLADYGRSCSLTSREGRKVDTLWGAKTILDRTAYWLDVGRGLFIYQSPKDELTTAQDLRDLCARDQRCEAIRNSLDRMGEKKLPEDKKKEQEEKEKKLPPEQKIPPTELQNWRHYLAASLADFFTKYVDWLRELWQWLFVPR